MTRTSLRPGRGGPSLGLGDAAARRSRTRGQALTEFAFVVPVFVLLLLGIADAGLGLYQDMNVINSARVGARFGSLNATNPAAVINAAQSSGVGTSATVTVSCWSVVANSGTQVPSSSPGGAGWESCSTTGTDAPAAGDTIAVTVSYPYTWMVPINIPFLNAHLFNSPTNLVSTVEMPVE